MKIKEDQIIVESLYQASRFFGIGGRMNPKSEILQNIHCYTATDFVIVNDNCNFLFSVELISFLHFFHQRIAIALRLF